MISESVPTKSSRLESSLLKEFTEGEQVVRINFFHVYLLTVRAMEEIGKRYMELMDSEELAELTPVNAAIHGLDEQTFYRNHRITISFWMTISLLAGLDKLLGDSAGLSSGLRKLQ